MQDLIGKIQIQVNDKIFLKDPYSSELGKKILSEGILLIDTIGLERFTFRKLARQMNTAESSVYRYFESKHKLLLYLTSWYWGWLEYRLVFATANIPSTEEKLCTAIRVLSEGITPSESHGTMNLEALNRIVVSESSKAYLTKEVDDANKIGFYATYKRLVARISDIVLEINPAYTYAHTLISTIVEGIHHQKYYANHLPALTDIKNDSGKLASFFTEMALSTIKNKQ